MKNDSFKGKFATVLPAGGLGKRMGGIIPKQLMKLGNKPVYQYCLETFLKMDEIVEIVIAVPTEWKKYFEEELLHTNSINTATSQNLAELIKSKLKIVEGGKERWQSVQNGINALTSNAEYVLVHDVARPFISEHIIHEVFETLIKKGSCLVAKPAVDTIKIANNGYVEHTIDRKKVWLAQTPQAARISLLKNLYARIETEPLNFTPTDEASILEFFGEPVYIVKGENQNDKLTTPEDFEILTSRIQS